MKSRKLTGLLFAIILSLAGCTGDVDDDEKGITHDDNEPSESLSMYHFDTSDSSDNLTNSTGDNMIDIVFTQGYTLNWSSVEIRISIDSTATVFCVADDSSASCTYASDSDLTWDVGESITISEGSNEDLCDGSTDCIVEVTIMKTENGTSHVIADEEVDVE
ncbi:MAG: hypothetical protein ACKVG2_05375 [Candidatus Poseidoniales archaeon]|jgi:hypothetical protein